MRLKEHLLRLVMPCVCKKCGEVQEEGIEYYDLETYWLCRLCYIKLGGTPW